MIIHTYTYTIAHPQGITYYTNVLHTCQVKNAINKKYLKML
jgi:hypothetical protein